MIDVCTFAIVIKCRLFYYKLLFISDQQEQNKSDFLGALFGVMVNLLKKWYGQHNSFEIQKMF